MYEEKEWVFDNKCIFHIIFKNAVLVVIYFQKCLILNQNLE